MVVGDEDWELVVVVCLFDCVWYVVDLLCDGVVGDDIVVWDGVDGLLYVVLEICVGVCEWDVECCVWVVVVCVELMG